MKYLYAIYHYILQTLVAIGSLVSVLLFAFIVVGVIYYYIKPDLPPQDIWDMTSEVLDDEVILDMQQSETLSSVFQIFEINIHDTD